MKHIEGVSWHRVEFWQIRNILEKYPSGIIDSCLGYGRPQTAHTTAKITKIALKFIARQHSDARYWYSNSAAPRSAVWTACSLWEVVYVHLVQSSKKYSTTETSTCRPRCRRNCGAVRCVALRTDRNPGVTQDFHHLRTCRKKYNRVVLWLI